MSTPSKTDNFEKLVSSVQSIRTYHKQVTKVKKYYQLSQKLINAYRKPSASTIYVAALDLTKKVATKTLMGKLIFKMHGPHFDILGQALTSNDKFEKLTRSVNQFSRSLGKLKVLKKRYLKDFKFDERVHGQGIGTYAMLHHDVLKDVESWLVREHLEAMVAHATHIVKSMDYFLWYYVRIRPHFKKLKKLLKDAKKNPKNSFDVIFGSRAYNNFQLSVELVGQLLKIRNGWANWLNKPSLSQSQYLNSSIATFGGRVPMKKLKKQPGFTDWLKDMVS